MAFPVISYGQRLRVPFATCMSERPHCRWLRKIQWHLELVMEERRLEQNIMVKRTGVIWL